MIFHLAVQVAEVEQVFQGFLRLVLIKNLFCVPSVGPKKKSSRRYGTFELLVRMDRSFFVQMQSQYQFYFTKHSLYYSSRAYPTQIQKDQSFRKLKPVYFVGIVNFNVFESKFYLSRHLILNTENHRQDIQDVKFYFLELKDLFFQREQRG